MLFTTTTQPASTHQPHRFAGHDDALYHHKPCTLATAAERYDDDDEEEEEDEDEDDDDGSDLANAYAVPPIDLVVPAPAGGSNPWAPIMDTRGPSTPRSAGRGSLMSPASTGPTSPTLYPHQASHPQIVVIDPPRNSFGGRAEQDDVDDPMAKSCPAALDETAFYANYPTYKRTPALIRPRRDASSVHNESPGTVGAPPASSPPSTLERLPLDSLDSRARCYAVHRSAPKLDRTMTDVYGDELYRPDFTVGSTSPALASVSPHNELFTQRLQAANSQHLHVGHPLHATTEWRDQSPFRHGSPLAPVPTGELPVSASSAPTCFGAARGMGEEMPGVQDGRAAQSSWDQDRTSEVSTPQTISPKDAMLEYQDAEAEADVHLALFPVGDAVRVETDDALAESLTQVSQQFDAASLDDVSFRDFMAHLPTSLLIPPPCSVSAKPGQHNAAFAASCMETLDVTWDSGHEHSPRRPENTSADAGTYTCTYHGCTMRFETPLLLQKHKREGHRHGPVMGGRRPDAEGTGLTANPLHSQAGPHRCDRINPSTGKPCHSIFSRPYDLTRHEDTIHNVRKQKVRCNLCTDDKSFSRTDALTRHYRVCHPEVDYQGKQRRRGVHGP